MDFGYFCEGAYFAADFVNTKSWLSGSERLGEPAAVRAFLAAHGLERRVAKADIPKLQALRDRVRSVFTADDEEQARNRIRALLDDFPSQAKLADGSGGHTVVFEPSRHDVVSSIGANIALGLAFFIGQHGTARLGICGAADCADAFVDGSKNSSKRCCSSECTRLENVRAFRARRRAGSET